MKRILYLSRGGNINGSQRQLYYAITNLAADYSPMVVCPQNGQFVEMLRTKNIPAFVCPLRPWRKFPQLFFRYKDAARLTAFAREHKVSLIHSSDLWLGGYMFRAAKKLQIPSILHIRAPMNPADIRKHHCHNATALVAISSRIQQNLLEAGIPPEKISHIHDAIDLNTFRQNDNTEKVLRRNFPHCGKILIGLVGRIEPSKRQLEFLEAAKDVINNTNTVTFFLIGEIHRRSYYIRLKQYIVQNALEKHVIFTGRREDIHEVLNSLDILVSLSGGSVMFEAAAFGKPVILAGFCGKQSLDAGPKQIIDPILRVPKISDLAETIINLIHNEDRRKHIGDELKDWIVNKFSHITMASKLNQLYDRLL